MKFNSISTKLFIVSLSFALPIAVMSTLMTKAKLKEIDFGAWEMKGNEYQVPLQKLFKQVSLHRLYVVQSANGVSDLAGSIAEEQKNIDATISELVAVGKKLDNDLQFTPEGLGKRQRTEFTTSNFEKRWSELKGKVNQSANDPALDAEHKALIAHLRAMITHAGDTSNLILDPDLDTYYLMDVTLLALPQMEDRLQEIGIFVERTQLQSQLNSDDSLQASVMSAFLREADHDRTIASAQTALNEDQNFYEISSSLQTNLKAGTAELTPAIMTIVEKLKARSNLQEPSQFDIAGFRKDLKAAIDTTYKFHFASINELNVLLTKRLDVFHRGVYDALIWGGFSVLLSAMLAFFIARNMVKRVKKFNEVTQLISSGNLTARVKMSGGDELTTLANSFDTMTDKIEILNAEIAARNEQLQEINANLEGIVSERTAQIKTILDNVRSGFLLVGADLKVQDGYSKFCQEILGDRMKSGANALQAFGMSEDRNAPMWREFMIQAFEDELPREMTLDQLPQRYAIDKKVVSISARSVRNSENKVSCLLFSIVDVTELEKAEKDSKHHQLLVRLLRETDAFRDFIEEVKTRLGLCRRFITHNEQGKVRAELHTIKGNTGAFDLTEIARLVHNIEDKQVIQSSDIDLVESSFRGFLDATYEVLQLSFDDGVKDEFVISKEQLEKMMHSINVSENAQSALDEVRNLISDLQFKNARTLIGSLPDYATRLGERLGKHLDVKVNGGDVRMNPELMRPVMQSLVHLVRNSVDHGIEMPYERGEKDETGHIVINCREDQNKWYVEIKDDGRGIDMEQVAKIALRKGVVTEEKLKNMNDAEKWRLIFLNGVSTSESVSDISGRGVGMGAVDASVREAGGTLDVSSVVGKGMSISISVPKIRAGHFLQAA